MATTGQLDLAWRKRAYHRQWLRDQANALFDFFQNRAFIPGGGFYEFHRTTSRPRSSCRPTWWG